MIPAGTGMTVPLFVGLGAVVLYCTVRHLPPQSRRWGGTITAAWLAAAFLLLLSSALQAPLPAGTSYLGLTTGLLITGLGALAAFASQGSLDPEGPLHIFYPLLLLSLAGAVAVGFATDLFTIFVAVELSAIPVYALVAYRHREDPKAVPAALKYLFQGVAGTLAALLGVSLLFLLGHSLSLSALPGALAGADPVALMAAAVLVLIGYGVKLAIVPVHMWLPDAYARAPPAVTAVMVGATKIGVLVAIFLTLSALPFRSTLFSGLGTLIIFLAVLTMTAGNLLALNQPDLRYILSYSSIAQMGYILLGFGMGMLYDIEIGFTAGLYYAIAYGIMKAGAFLATGLFGQSAGSYETARMRGLGARHPVLGVSFVVFVLGLIGVPFTCGFLGKLLLEQAGMVTSTMSGFVLALILALNSAVSLGYYVPVLSTLLFGGPAGPEGTKPGRSPLPHGTVIVVAVLAIVTFYLGLFPESFGWITEASLQLFPWGAV